MNEDYDFVALEEAEMILNHEIPSSPETYRAVKKWYERNSASVQTVKRDCDEPLPF